MLIRILTTPGVEFKFVLSEDEWKAIKTEILVEKDYFITFPDGTIIIREHIVAFYKTITTSQEIRED